MLILLSGRLFPISVPQILALLLTAYLKGEMITLSYPISFHECRNHQDKAKATSIDLAPGTLRGLNQETLRTGMKWTSYHNIKEKSASLFLGRGLVFSWEANVAPGMALPCPADSPI